MIQVKKSIFKEMIHQLELAQNDCFVQVTDQLMNEAKTALKQGQELPIHSVMLSLLKTAKCPDCDGSGAKIVETTKIGTRWVDDGNGNPYLSQCKNLIMNLNNVNGAIIEICF